MQGSVQEVCINVSQVCINLNVRCRGRRGGGYERQGQEGSQALLMRQAADVNKLTLEGFGPFRKEHLK